MCEASNDASRTQDQVSRRYIKVNPNGAPVLGVLPTTSLSSLTNDQIMSAATHPHFDQQMSMVELPVTIGSSVSLTCLVEPMPSLQRIEWLRENGKIIPESKYEPISTEYEINHRNVETTSQESSLVKTKNARSLRNFKVKYESTDDESVSNLNGELSEPLDQPVVSTSNYLVTSNGVLPASDSSGPIRSVLSLKHIRNQDLGVYKCKSTNSYGSRTALILLREKTLIGNRRKS